MSCGEQQPVDPDPDLASLGRDSALEQKAHMRQVGDHQGNAVSVDLLEDKHPGV
jgi:hypothetical protein